MHAYTVLARTDTIQSLPTTALRSPNQPGVVPRVSAIILVFFLPGRCPPWPGFTPCDILMPNLHAQRLK